MTTPSPHLFSPFQLRSVTLKNRLVISPMCQYSAQDGLANPWHFVHLAQFALGGAALVFTEAAAVEPRGRITHGDLGIWSQAHAKALKPAIEFIKQHGATPAVQLAHAGRKASMQRPWYGNGPLDVSDTARGDLPWDIVAPSAEPVREGWLLPHELDHSGINTIQQAFADAAIRCAEIGVEVIELHCAHGYLGHSFLSPLSNHRTDGYGGDRKGRMRFVLELIEQTRRVWPEDKPLFVRISSVDLEPEGWTIDDSIALAQEMLQRGVDVIDCSSGGLKGLSTRSDQPLPLGFRVPYSEQIRAATDAVTMTHGLIVQPEQAEALVRENRADLIGIARTALYDPYWPRHAAHALGADPEFTDWPEQYGWWLTRRETLLQTHGVTQSV